VMASIASSSPVLTTPRADSSGRPRTSRGPATPASSPASTVSGADPAVPSLCAGLPTAALFCSLPSNVSGLCSSPDSSGGGGSQASNTQGTGSQDMSTASGLPSWASPWAGIVQVWPH
jgi:hypothetical protein